MDDPTRRSTVKKVFSRGISENEIEETLEVFESIGIEILFPDRGDSLPSRLRDGPKWDFLTLLGDPTSLRSERIIGIVGRRDPTDAGLQFAHDLAEAFGRKGVPTLSGMARGIDQAAHHGSLSMGAPTIGVVPEGVLRFLRRNKEEFPNLHDGSESPLLVISGVSPNERWSVGEAMRRNRWIANWCDALIVVEANLEGGTWRTVEAAAHGGKPIWVCTGFGEDEGGLGNSRLASTYHAMELDIGMEVEAAVEKVFET